MKAAALRRLTLAAITKDRVLMEVGRIAFVNVTDFFNDDWTIKKPSELDKDQSAALQSFEVVVTDGDGSQTRLYRIRCHDKIRALELLARYFGLLKDGGPADQKIEISWRPHLCTRCGAAIPPGTACERLDECHQ